MVILSRSLPAEIWILLVLFAPLPAEDVQIAPALGEPEHQQPRFTFKLSELQPGVARGKDRWLVGRVHVFKPAREKSKSLAPHQVIEVVMNEPESFFAQFGAKRPDLNCDGYPDLQISQFGGAKWGRAHVWLYQPATGAFVSTNLTRQFALLSYANYRIDPKAKRLHLRQFRGAQLFESIYRITPERLLFESKHLVPK